MSSADQHSSNIQSSRLWEACMINLRLKVNKSPCACWERSEERPGSSWARHTCEAYRKRRRVQPREEHEDPRLSSNFTPADIRGVNISAHHKKHPLDPSHMCTVLGSCKPLGHEPDLWSQLDCVAVFRQERSTDMHIQYVLQVTTHSSHTSHVIHN